jgi:hypothetical protein
MKRRELIKLVTLATGSVLSASLLNSLLVGCKDVPSKYGGDYILQFFNEEDFLLVQSLMNTILPKTESPSATDVSVHQIMDTMIGTVYKPSERVAYKKRFLALKQFLKTSTEKQLVALQNLTESTNENDEIAKGALLDLKQQTIAYYLSTEKIAKNYLNYLPIPGQYKACISLDEVDGKAWAL